MILKKYYKSILSFAFILFLCLMPGSETKKIMFFDFPHLDKIVHFGMFFLFSFALFIDLNNNTEFPKKKILLTVFFLSFFVGVITEIIQKYFIPLRSGDLLDLLADTAGYAGFLFVIYFIRKES
ncbi:MAG: VanZ family protein [Chlorobi bacterium]|nr:VanZ family protein [Chlorobiota bacterium]